MALTPSAQFSCTQAAAQGKSKKTAQQSAKPKTKAKAKAPAKSKPKASAKAKTPAKSKAKAPAKPKTQAEIKREQEATAREIALTKEQIQKNEQEVKRGLTDLGKLQAQISDGEKKLTDSRREVERLTKRIGDLESSIAGNEKELERMRSEYLKAVKKMRLRKNSNSTLAFIFAADNFKEALRRMRYLRQFSDWRQKTSGDITDKMDALKREKQSLQTTVSQKEKALAEQTLTQQGLQKQYNQQDALVGKLKANGSALRSHLAKKQSEANALKNQIASLIAQEQQKEEARRAEARRQADAEAKRRAEAEAAKSAAAEPKQQTDAKDKQQPEKEDKKSAKSKKESDPKKDSQSKKDTENRDYAEARKRKPRSKDAANTEQPVKSSEQPAKTTEQPTQKPKPKADSGFAGMKGSLPRPVEGAFVVTSPFGRHSLPDMPDVEYDNPGVDAEVAKGASARAVFDGKVTGVYKIPGYETVVIVSHGDYYTVYGNIETVTVKVGDSVKQGQNLGRLATEEDDDSHSLIHFEVWHNREKQNPMSWVR